MKHEAQMFRLARKFDGFVVQAVGDAFFIYFRSLLGAIDCAIALQCEQKSGMNPVRNRSRFHFTFRVGIAYGRLSPRLMRIQDGVDIWNLTGPLANIGSHMESKVADVGGVAITSMVPGVISPRFLLQLRGRYSRSIHFSLKPFFGAARCSSTKTMFRRSYRTLIANGFMDPIDSAKCPSLNILKGAGKMLAIKIKLDDTTSCGAVLRDSGFA